MATASDTRGLPPIPSNAEVRAANPGTAFTTLPKPTAAEVFMIAMTEPDAPSLMAGIKVFHRLILKTAMRAIPVPMAAMAGH